MPTLTKDMSQFQVNTLIAVKVAEQRARETRLVYLVFVDPVNGNIDIIADMDRFQIGEATVLRRVYPPVLSAAKAAEEVGVPREWEGR